MSWLFVALLACAVAVLIGAEWPRLAEFLGRDARRGRARARRKASLKLLRTEPRSESEEFEASVQRDLSRLPTVKERDPKR
ncbi:MAG: hypothetical protein M3M94_06015 [Actinomycetota bacterium]|nr:hypothetical protein [Actinomycetota bacterium]